MGDCNGCNCSAGHEHHCPKKENNYLIQYNLELNEEKSDEWIKKIQSSLIEIQGVETIDIEESILKIFYDDMLISPDMIENKLKELL
ncbi:hypothetical protein [Natronospora cellulosivora (SeqCode)]